MTNRNLAEAQYSSDDEISLREIWQVLVRYKWLVLGMPAIAVVAAIAISTLMKPVWEATAVIQVGQVEQHPIEPVARTVERMKIRSFQNAVLTSEGIAVDQKTPPAVLFRHSMKANVLPNTDLINLQVRAYSRDKAKRLAEAVFEHLRRRHAELASPTIERLKQKLAEVRRQIVESRAARDALVKMSVSPHHVGSGDAFMEKIVLANIMLTRDEELRALEQGKRLVDGQLSPFRTFPTSPAGEVYAANEPVAPKKRLIVALGGTLGLMLGIFVASVLSALGNKQGKNT